MKNVFVVDIGSQSMRGIIFDEKGNTVAKEQVKYMPYISKENGFMEQSVEMYWNVLCDITKKIVTENPDAMKDVIAVSIDTFRDTAVLLDENNDVLRNVILWSDQRTASTEDKLPAKQRFCFGLVGMTSTVEAIRKKVKTRWIQQNEPSLWKKVKKVVHISAYVNYKITGKLVDSTASTIGHLPFNYKKNRWLDKNDLLYPVYAVDSSLLCDLVSPGDKIGVVTEEASKQTLLPQGLPVIAGGSDKGCETLGVGCISENVASVSFGTSSTVQFTTKHYFEPERFMPSYPAVIKGFYNPEAQVFRGYWMISWFKDNFAKHLENKAQQTGKNVEAILDEETKSVPAGSEGLLLQPYWQAGLTTPEARGAIIGFSDYHTRAHVYRAIIEGIDYDLRQGLERMERRGHQKIDYLAIAGGGSQSDIICQIASDIFNKEVKRVQTHETSALGCAIVAFYSMGIYDSIEKCVEEMVHYKDSFTPNKANVKVYDDIYKGIYVKLYSKLKRFYKRLNK